MHECTEVKIRLHSKRLSSNELQSSPSKKIGLLPGIMVGITEDPERKNEMWIV